jgi:hypothetical protein
VTTSVIDKMQAQHRYADPSSRETKDFERQAALSAVSNSLGLLDKP